MEAAVLECFAHVLPPATFVEDVIDQPARAQFEAFLDDHHRELNSCLDGLTEQQARRSLVRSQTTLLGLVKEMQANPGLTVELAGYTDMKGARDYNYNLSQRRVEAVRRFLVERGVQIGRIQAVGLGALSDRATPEAQKRRVAAKLMIDQD